MATRIDIELTSRKDDGTFTWRAAGAREPRGTAATTLFPDGASVGDTFKVDADVELDGITVTYVHPPKGQKKGPELLELLSTDDGPLVTQQLAEKGRRGGGGDRRGGRGRGRRDDDRGGRGGRTDRDDRGGRERGDDDRGGRGRRRQPRGPVKPKLPPKPKPPRLNVKRQHRTAFLDSVPAEQRPIAEELVRGGLPGLRKALEKQNEEHKAAGRPEVGDELMAIGEQLMPKVRLAEWRDRADAALEQAETVDLRDLRSVVTAADSTARDEESRAVAAQLRDALSRRLEADTAAWLVEITEMLDDDRVVRALHLSSRPPKAGAPLPADLAKRLVEAANASLTSETSQDRWTYILEALAPSPVRRQVVPESLPANVSDDLAKVIARLGDRLPEIAHIFGIEPARKPRGKKKRPPKPAAGAKKGGADEPESTKDETAKAESDTDETAKAESDTDETAKAESDTDETPKDEPSKEAETAENDEVESAEVAPEENDEGNSAASDAGTTEAAAPEASEPAVEDTAKTET